MQRTIVILSVLLLVCATACMRGKMKTKATCSIAGACWVCPDADAALRCLQNLNGTAAGCESAPMKECK